MANEKLELTNTAISIFLGLGTILGAILNKIINSVKEKAQFVTKRELATILKGYARKETVQEVRNDVIQGFARMERLYAEDRERQERIYIEDKRMAQDREIAMIRRIDQIMNGNSGGKD